MLYKENPIQVNYKQINTKIAQLGYSQSYKNFFKQLKLRILDNDLYSNMTVTRKQFNKLLYGKSISEHKLESKCKEALFNFLLEDNSFSKALDLISSFKSIITNESNLMLDKYLKIYDFEEYKEWISVKTFMDGVKRDIDAINNQIINKITNSTTEGFVSKIKKRTYGRVSFAHIKSLLLL